MRLRSVSMCFVWSVGVDFEWGFLVACVEFGRSKL